MPKGIYKRKNGKMGKQKPVPQQVGAKPARKYKRMSNNHAVPMNSITITFDETFVRDLLMRSIDKEQNVFSHRPKTGRT